MNITVWNFYNMNANMNTHNYHYLGFRILNIILLCFLLSFSAFGQLLCDQGSCIKASLNQVDNGLMVIPGYEDIGIATLPCDYENINGLGVLFELADGNTNPVWTINGNTSGDGYELVSGGGIITISVTHSAGSCACRVILNEPIPPVANPVSLNVCGYDTNMGAFDLFTIRNDIDSDGNGNGIVDDDAGHLVTFHETQGQANVGTPNIDPSLPYSTSGGTIYARLEAVNGNGCFSVAEVTLNVNPSPDVNINLTPNQTTITCDVTTITAEAVASGGQGNYTYDWSNVQGMSDPNSTQITTSGTYAVIVTDENSCSNTEEVVINENTAPPTGITATANGILACDGQPVILTGNSSTPNVNYSWTGPNNFTGTGASVNVMAVGQYTLTITRIDNGCIGTTTVMVNGSPMPVPTISPNSSTLTCTQTEIMLAGSATGGTGDLTYLWSTNETSESINIMTPGTYTLTVTDANGCSGTTDVIVTQDVTLPTANNASITSCDNNNSGIGEFDLTQADVAVSGGQSGVSVTYHETMANANSGNDPIASPYTSGEKTVFARVIDDMECYAVSEITLTLPMLQTPIMSFTPSLQGLCDDRQVITVSVENPLPDYTYTWSVNGSLSGVDNQEGCAALELVNTGVTTNVVLTYALGTCSNSIFESLTWGNAPDPNTKILRIGQTNTLFCNKNNFVSYQWGRESRTTLCPEILNWKIYQYCSMGNIDTDSYFYWVIVEDATGCTRKLYYGDDPFMKVIPEEPVDYGKLNLQVIPNPSDGAFEVQLIGNDDKALHLHLYDTFGHQMYRQKIDKLNFVERVFLSFPALPDGLYFLQVADNYNIYFTEKIIIK